MDVAIAGAAEFGRVGRRLIQRIWDPEPVNRATPNEPVWCLGCRYVLEAKTPATTGTAARPTNKDEDDLNDNNNGDSTRQAETVEVERTPGYPTPPADTGKRLAESGGSHTPATPPDSVASSFDSSLALSEESLPEGGWPVAFLDDFDSRIWMTYRSQFPPIARSPDPRAVYALSFTMRLKTSFSDQAGFSSDTGWGCMIRSGQSLLANAMAITRLGRDWRRSASPDAERDIISLFADDPRAPYSIHNFVRHGAEACGKYPGEWFGPSATARCIRYELAGAYPHPTRSRNCDKKAVLTIKRALANAHEPTLRVYTSGDMGDVYEDSFMEVARSNGDSFHPTLVLVCTRLGTDTINQVYEEALIATLQMPQSVGIAGGRPSSSHYFVGTQGRWLFYLDPHHPRPALPYYADTGQYTLAELDTCHSRRLRQLHVRDMDPSMLVGFLIRDEEDWISWKAAVRHVQGKAIINVAMHDPAKGSAPGRAGAIDEVEIISDNEDDETIAADEDDGDTVLAE